MFIFSDYGMKREMQS